MDFEQEWPNEVIAFLGARQDALMSREQPLTRGRHRISLQEYEVIMAELRSILNGYSLRGYHCTRLTDREIQTIQRGGMQLPNLEMLRSRILAVQQAALVPAHLAARLCVENQADHRYRARMVWFCFYPPHRAEEDGIERFFRSWGGEALYNSHEDDPETGPLLGTIGTPCVVEAEVCISSLQPFGRVEEVITRNFLVRRGLRTSEDCDLEAWATKPIAANCIIGVHRYPESEFRRLTECDSWIRPLA